MIDSPLLERNLKILEHSQPILAEKLRKHLKSMEGGFSIHESQGPVGKWVSSSGYEAFFQKSPKDGENPTRSRGGDCVFMVRGIGVPPYLFHILRSLPNTALSVVVVEPSLERILYTLSMTSVYSALPRGCRLSFVAIKDQYAIHEALDVNIKPIGIFLVNTAVQITHDGELEALGEEFLALEREMWRQIRLSVEYLGNTAEDTMIGVRNFALNTPWILDSPKFSDFPEFQGRPCICVASGPSLDKNIHLLKDISDKFVIIAADTAAKKLIPLGIIPHFLTSIERPEEMYTRNFAPLIRDFPDECSKIVFVGSFVCASQTIARWPGPVKIIGKKELDLDHWLLSSIGFGELMPCGASVAHMAISVAANIKASSIALIGQDLAFSDDGKSHAHGTASEQDMAEEVRDNLLEVPGIYGKPVKTHVTWLKFISIFQSFGNMCANSGIKLCDCTQGGALIPGSVVEDLADFIEREGRDLLPFADGPWIIARNASAKKDTAALAALAQERLHDTGHPMVQASLDDIKEIETQVKAVTETILPAQRREHSLKAAVALDRLHASNSPLAFIGQSYTYLSGSIMAETRNLETMEDVYRWRKAYEDIIEGHRVILNFFTQWFFYAAKAAYWYGKDPKNRETLSEHLSQEEIVREAQDLLSEFMEIAEDKREETGDELVRLCRLLGQIDENQFPKSKEAGEVLWRLAKMTASQGRSERASKMILAAYGIFNGMSLEEDAIVSFLEDFSMILSKPDLTFMPLFPGALSGARNLARYGQEERSEELCGKIKKLWHEYLDNLRASRVIQAKNPLDYYRLLGDLALLEGNFGKAIYNAWTLVERSYDVKDQKGEAVFQWLCRYLDVASKAENQEYVEAGEKIESELAQSPEIIGYFRPVMSGELLSRLQKMGLSLHIETVEQ